MEHRPNILGPKVKPFLRDLEEPDNILMDYHYAFRLSRRAGGVNDIGRAVGRQRATEPLLARIDRSGIGKELLRFRIIKQQASNAAGKMLSDGMGSQDLRR